MSSKKEKNILLKMVYKGYLPFLLILCISSCFLSKKAIKYSVEPTLMALDGHQENKKISFGDSLFLVETEDSMPHHYFQQ